MFTIIVFIYLILSFIYSPSIFFLIFMTHLEYVFLSFNFQLNETNVFDFWNMANFLQSTHLRGACKQYLFKEISTTNCLGIYEHALLYNELDFSDFCFQYILTHFQGIIKTNEFCHTSFKTLHKVLSSKVVNVLHEADLYKVKNINF